MTVLSGLGPREPPHSTLVDPDSQFESAPISRVRHRILSLSSLDVKSSEPTPSASLHYLPPFQISPAQRSNPASFLGARLFIEPILGDSNSSHIPHSSTQHLCEAAAVTITAEHDRLPP